ncbi:MAG TPA: hypothetical protein VGO59_00265 [Verrucomicrobiae bacterium]|jgi:hypothetical protein
MGAASSMEYGSLYGDGRIRQNKSVPLDTLEHASHGVAFMNEGLRRQFCASINGPTLALQRHDVAKGCALEKGREILDAHFSLLNRFGSEGVFDAVQPTIGNCFKAQSGVLPKGQAADLPLDFLQTAVGQFAILFRTIQFTVERQTGLP